MITNIIIPLWIVFILVLIGLMTYRLRNPKGMVFPFQNFDIADLPYIVINIQGYEFNMVVDSGASMSVIAHYALPQLLYSESVRKVEIGAMTDETTPSRVVTIPFNIGDKHIAEDFVVHPTNDLANFGAWHGITMHGILGKEFFEKTGCKIDYRNHSVTLY